MILPGPQPQGGIESQVEIRDDEIPLIATLVDRLESKYSSRPSTPGNLDSLVHELEDGFRELGFEVTVNLGKRILREAMGVEYDDPSNTQPENFTISIDARLTEFDTEHQRHAVRSGVADQYWDEYRKRHGTTKKGI